MPFILIFDGGIKLIIKCWRCLKPEDVYPRSGEGVSSVSAVEQSEGGLERGVYTSLCVF